MDFPVDNPSFFILIELFTFLIFVIINRIYITFVKLSSLTTKKHL